MPCVTSYLTSPAIFRYNQASMRKPILILLSYECCEREIKESPFHECWL
jgi:hypothetical protein